MTKPFVSILVPVRNEAKYIFKCLQAVITQDYPSGLIEVLVIDGMSVDGTRDIIQKFQKTNPSIKLLDNPKLIVPTGLNLAMGNSKGDILIRVDGHCIIASDYVSRCVEHLVEGVHDAVGGSLETIGENRLSRAIALAMSSRFGVGNSAFRTLHDKTLETDTVPFPAYARGIIEKAGSYDEELVRNQDDEYNYRIRDIGGRLLLAADVHATYFTRSSIQDLWKQFFLYGYYKIRVLQKHPKQMKTRQFMPLLFVLGLITLGVLSFYFSGCRILFILLCLSYFIANFISSINLSEKHGYEHLILLPSIFLTIHLAYGFGFIAGLFKFWNRWGDKIGKTPVRTDGPSSGI